jgi:LacI family transcriptional regulator
MERPVRCGGMTVEIDAIACPARVNLTMSKNLLGELVKPRSGIKGRRRPPSIKDVAKRAGVSIAAASYAVNGRDGVAEKTRQRIMEAVEELNYQPSKFAQSMRTGKTDAIGLVLPDLSNPFFPQFAKAVQQSAGQIGKSVLLIDTSNDAAIEREGVKRLVSQGVDGIIWWPSSTENCQAINELGPPIVLVDFVKPGIDSVTSDHDSGGRLLASFVNKARGNRIGLIRGPVNYRSASLRRDGFVNSLERSKSIVWEHTNAFSPPISDAIKSELALTDVDVVICPNDLIAIEVIRYLKSLGREVPDDMAVTGFGDIPFADIVSPALTTIHQPLAELGRKAVDLLIRRFETPDAEAQDIVLGVNLVVRDSLKCG